MSGSLLTNSEISQLITEHKLSIRPYEEERFQVAHYPIDPETILTRENGEWKYAHSFKQSQNAFTLSPHQYVLIEIRQHIELTENYIGTFIASSNLIEKGLSITLGKISFPFGEKNERVRFGVRNNLNEPTQIYSNDLVAYLQIFDISKSKKNRYALNSRDESVYAMRKARANDDGVNYEIEEYSPI